MLFESAAEQHLDKYARSFSLHKEESNLYLTHFCSGIFLTILQRLCRRFLWTLCIYYVQMHSLGSNLLFPFRPEHGVLFRGFSTIERLATFTRFLRSFVHKLILTVTLISAALQQILLRRAALFPSTQRKAHQSCFPDSTSQHSSHKCDTITSWN